MSDDFRLGSTPRARQQLRDYASKAIKLGIPSSVAKAMNDIAHRLGTDPLNFGEPVNNTKKPGGLVYKAVRRPHFSLTFAVYPEERVVLLLDVLLLRESTLE